MSLADVYLFSKAPREMARFYLGSIMVLLIFVFLFDDWFKALIYYLIFLVISIPVLIPIARALEKKRKNEEEHIIESDLTTDKIITREQIDKYLDKSKCMSCMAPVEEDESFCSNCGYKLIK